MKFGASDVQSLIAATVVTLFTVASTVAAQAQRADAIIGLQLEPPHLDPTSAAAGAIDQVLYANVFEGLTRFGPNGSVQPGLAASWTISDDGLSYSGILKEESETELVLLNAEGKTVRIPKETIEQRGKGKSSMPADLINNLSKMEVRDLVEFLSSLKE